MKSKDITKYIISISDVTHFISDCIDTDTTGNVIRMLKNLNEIHIALKEHRQKQLLKNAKFNLKKKNERSQERKKDSIRT